MKFIKVETENRSLLQPSDAAEGLGLIKRTREARPIKKLCGSSIDGQMFHLTSLFNAVELLVHLELMDRADGFELLIGKVENYQSNHEIQIHTWLQRNAIVYHVDDPIHLPIIAEDRCEFDQTPGVCPPLQTIEHHLLQLNRPLMRAVTMAIVSCRAGRRPYVEFDTMEVTQELLQTAINVRARSLDQYVDLSMDPQQNEIDLNRSTPLRRVV